MHILPPPFSPQQAVKAPIIPTAQPFSSQRSAQPVPAYPPRKAVPAAARPANGLPRAAAPTASLRTAAAQPTLFAHPSTAATSSQGSSPSPIAQTGPDYMSVFRDRADETRYQECKKAQVDWNRHLCNEPGIQDFFRAVQEIWHGTAWHWDGNIDTLTLEIINDSMIIFSARNDLQNLYRALQLGADVGFINSKGTHVLTAAIKNAKVSNVDDCLRYLLTQLKLNVSRRNGNGSTALIQAALGKDEMTIEPTLDFLIAQGACLSEIDKKSEENIIHKLLQCDKKGNSNHADLVFSIIEKYSHRIIGSGNPKGLDFSQISTVKKNILGGAFFKLMWKVENILRLFDSDSCLNIQSSLAKFQTQIAPDIRLCRKIRELSNISYAAASYSNGRESLPAVMECTYENLARDVARLKILMLVDREFVRDIQRECESNAINRHASNFLELYTNAELQIVGGDFKSSIAATPT